MYWNRKIPVPTLLTFLMLDLKSSQKETEVLIVIGHKRTFP